MDFIAIPANVALDSSLGDIKESEKHITMNIRKNQRGYVKGIQTLTRTIKKVSVEHLFGRYDYQLRLSESENESLPMISLLYGDNGTGKTTILKLIFHILSSGLSQGHKSYVAGVPFQKFSIEFSDGATVSASRPSDSFSGSFYLTMDLGDGNRHSALFRADPETGAVSRSDLTEPVTILLNKIADLNLEVFYLGDTRALESDSIPRSDHTWPLRRRFPRQLDFFNEFEVVEDIDEDDLPGSNLGRSIRLAERWLDREAIRTSSIGETDAQQIYGEILETVATASTVAESDLATEVENLKIQLEQLEITSRDFAMFGLGSAIESRTLLDSLERANDSSLPIVVQVLGPILHGQRARLDAVRALYEKVHRFVNIANSYLTDKEVNFDAGKGLVIQLPQQTLNPDLLSSGEKHLLLLFLSVFTSSDRSPLFIIDEPELSLNIKWQRTLVDSLLTLSENSRCQFLMATHSIELLTKHMDHVVGLHPHD